MNIAQRQFKEVARRTWLRRSRLLRISAGSDWLRVLNKKQSDGGWKAVEDFAVADPDSAKTVPPGKPATRAKMVSM